MTSSMVGPPVRLAVRLVFSHHPLCSYFAHDVLRLGPLKVCAGCIVMWPTAFASVAVAMLVLEWSPRTALLIGTLLGMPYVLAAFTNAPRTFRGAAKLVGGVGLGLAVWGFVFVPVPVVWKLVGVLLATLGFLLLLGVRMRRIIATCRGCPYAMDWESCPGMFGHVDVAGPAPPVTVGQT